MRNQETIVKEKFDERWSEFNKGYADLEKKMSDSEHVVHGDIAISQVNRAVMTNKYIFENYDKTSAYIIEAACGNGFNPCYLGKQGYRVSAFDVSESAVSHANELRDSLNVKGVDFTNSNHTYFENVEDNSVDAVVALGLMRYLQHDAREYIYKHVYRVLKTKGTFIVSNDNLFFELFALNDGTTKFWTNIIEGFSDAKKLLPNGNVKEALEREMTLPKRQYAAHSVSQHIQRHAENPLLFSKVAELYGFRLVKNVYPDCHVLPPLYERTVDVEELEKIKAKMCLKRSEDWRAMFMDDEFLSFLIKE